MSLNDAALEMVLNGSLQTVGLRFTDVEIPQGASILEAHVQFTAEAGTAYASNLLIQGQNHANAPRFQSTNANLSSRPRTLGSVVWSPPAWTTGAVGSAERSPDLSAVVQEIVNKGAWSSGNSLVLLLTGTGQRVATAFERNPATAPLLHVRYAPVSCGNGVKELGERCDGADLGSFSCAVLGCSGGALSCTNACEPDASACTGCPVCGNGILEGFEDCDDGNALTDACAYGEGSCLACDSECRLVSGATTFCGDGFTDGAAGEHCDDANPDNTDGCLDTCAAASCGDGLLQVGVEQCDHGNVVTELCSYGQTSCLVCNAVCSQVPGATSYCGDGFPDPANGEACDDGNAGNTDGCLASCLTASCGDGFVQVGVEECDDANASNSDTCLTSCLAASCGDGFVRVGVEPCDDGNASNADACLNSCQIAACGDGFVQAGVEQCDDGNTVTERCEEQSCLVCDATCHQVIPEPSQGLLILAALATLGALARRRRP
jgi:cysteine-rich repeat protein